jgi:hypothetical protein
MRSASSGSSPPTPKVPGFTTKSEVKALSMEALMDVRVEAARMEMKPMRATPIISADAVAAVRFGLRMAFSRARFPVTPRRPGSGAPMARLSGRAMVRPRTDTPKNTSRTPSPTRASALDPPPKRPPRSEATPRPSSTAPTTIRSLEP